MSQAFSPPVPLPSGNPPSFAAWIVSGICLIITAFAWHEVKRSEQLDERARFERQAVHAVARIEQALSSCELALRSAAALIDSQTIPRTRWREYMATLSSAPPVPGIREFGFALATDADAMHTLPASEADSAHRALKLARIAAFHFGSGMTAVPRELAPDRLPAAASGSPLPRSIDDMLSIRGDNAPRTTALMYLAARQHTDGQERNAHPDQLLGYAYARISIRDLVEGALQETDSQFRIRVFEGSSVDQKFLLYDSNRPAVAMHTDADKLMLSKAADIDLNGNRWTIRFDVPASAMLSSHVERAGTYILGAGLILMLSLFGAARAVVQPGKPLPSEQERAHQALKDRVSAIEALRDEEQKRLGQEMHDDLGQLLAAMKMDLAGLARHLQETDSAALHRLSSINELVNTMMTSVRRIISDLPPKALEDLGLFDALRLMVQNFEKRHHVRCHVCLPEYELRMPQKAVSAIYRMIQESLTNVAKHACATDVEISMEILDNRVLLSIADNGKGFSTQALQKAGSFGLIGMRERAATLGGGMKVESTIGSGTTIYITLPLADKRYGDTELRAPSMLADNA